LQHSQTKRHVQGRLKDYVNEPMKRKNHSIVTPAVYATLYQMNGSFNIESDQSHNIATGNYNDQTTAAKTASSCRNHSGQGVSGSRIINLINRRVNGVASGQQHYERLQSHQGERQHLISGHAKDSTRSRVGTANQSTRPTKRIIGQNLGVTS
jgi:hypothetical protein